MKKFFNLLCLAAFTTSIFVACSKNDTSENLPVTNKKTVSFNAKSADTKTYFGDKTSAGYPTVWSENKKVKIFLNYEGGQEANVTPSGNGKTASFDASFNKDTTVYTFYAISPNTVSLGIVNKTEFNLEFPASQAPTIGSVDEAAHIMAAKSETFTEMPEKVTLTFSHIAAYGRFMLKNFPETVTINSIDLAADENVTGRFYFNQEAGTFTENSASKIVTLNASGVVAENNASKVFWFAFKPVNLEGKNLKVTVHTDAGDFIKTITFPTGKGNFQAGRVASFNIDMSDITPSDDKVFRLVTDNSQLLLGTKVIIVARDAAYAIGTTQNTNNRAQSAVTKSADLQTITNPSEAVQVFSLEAGTNNNTIAFRCEGENDGLYIYAASSSGNQLKSSSTKNGNASFAVTFEAATADHSAYSTVIAQGTNTRNVLQYNSGSSLFACYGSNSQGEVALYAQEGTGEGSSLIGDPLCPTPTITYDATTKTVTINCTAEGATVGYTTDGSTPAEDNTSTIISTTLPVVFGITETCTVKAIAGAPGYEMSEIASQLCEVGGTAGTEDNPYTATEAAEAANSGSTAEVYVKGIISSIADAYNSYYNNVSFFISDDGTSNTFEIFRADATSADDFKVGDIVVFKGNLTVYNSTPEMAQGNELISQVKAPRFNPDGGTFTSSQSVTLSADDGATIYYTTDGSTPTATTGTVYSGAITVSETTTIKAIAVVGEETTGVASATFTKVSATVKTATFTFSKMGFENAENITVIIADDNDNEDIKLTYDSGTNSSNSPKYYSTGSGIRMYNGNTLTISGGTITKVELTASGSSYLTNASCNTGSITASGTVETWTGNTTSLVLSAKQTCRTQKIVVTYE